MRFFYTGAERANVAQANPQVSLGGFLSSSVVPNNFNQNLFSDISNSMANKGCEEIRGIILKNELPNKIENLYFYFDNLNDIISTFEIAAVSVVDNQIEKIVNGTSTPYNATFYSANTAANKVFLIDELAFNGLLGLWIKRTISPQTIQEDCEALETYWQNLNKQESPTINIEYTNFG